jgi:5-methyltetrahydrofolate--homocysteine methyltransferase
MVEGAGFEVIDLGHDVSPGAFVAAAKERNADIVGLSALLTTTMPSIVNTIQAFKNEGMRDSVKIIVGGAPVTQRYADEIGADGYSPDAAGAANMAKMLVGMT